MLYTVYSRRVHFFRFWMRSLGLGFTYCSVYINTVYMWILYMDKRTSVTYYVPYLYLLMVSYVKNGRCTVTRPPQFRL
jgi:hypothetical protein